MFVFSVGVGSKPSLAHSDLESSSPADGTTTEWPLEEVELSFNAEIQPLGDGFVVRDACGSEIKPTSKQLPDSGGKNTWILEFDDSLVPGPTSVQWAVKSADGHIVRGGITFEIVQQTSEPDAEDCDSPKSDTTTPSTTGPTSPQPPTTHDADVSGPTTASDNLPDTPLDFEQATNAELVRGIGVGSETLGSLFLVGIAALVSLIFRPEDRSLRESALFNSLGLVSAFSILLGILIKLLGSAAQAASGWGEAAGILASNWVEIGTTSDVMRGTGAGLLLAAGLSNRKAITQRLTNLKHERLGVRPTLSNTHDLKIQNPPKIFTTLGWAAIVLLLVSSGFDGHSATEPNRVVKGIASVVHFSAAGTWLGVVAGVAILFHGRRRRQLTTDRLLTVEKLSAIALISLVAVSLAGTALTVTIVPSLMNSQWLSTRWGLLLIGKMAIVASAVAHGGYIRFSIKPRISLDETDELVFKRLQRSLKTEAILLVAAGIITTFLVSTQPPS